MLQVLTNEQARRRAHFVRKCANEIRSAEREQSPAAVKSLWGEIRLKADERISFHPRTKSEDFTNGICR